MSCLTSRRDTAGIILAAGASTRLGRPKQLVLLDGQPLLERVINAALESNLDHIVLVLGSHAAEIKRALGSILDHNKLSILVNPNYHTGMAGSLKMGIRQIKNVYGAAMIILADHPNVDSGLINHLLARFQATDKAICVPTFKGRRGHPVCLSQKFYADIRSLTGDIGAREILRDHPDQLLTVELDSDRAFMDIDTKSDLERAIALCDNKSEVDP
jgi:molybdenum cofactor cytidylyltransferase